MDSLVNYSDSDGEASEEEVYVETKPPVSKKARLLPSAFQFAEETQPVDAAEDVEGRVRSFPHEEGNWATYVFIPVDLSAFVDTHVETITVNPALKLLAATELHVSLSRTVSIRHHWICDMERALRKACLRFPSFSVTFSGIEVLVNDEKTRTFLSLVMDCGYDQCSKLRVEVDSVFQDFNLPPYYANAKFHASFAWCLGDQKASLEANVLPKLTEQWDIWKRSAHHSAAFPIDVDEIRMRTGNKLFNFPLIGN